jgi:hypothetical protein
MGMEFVPDAFPEMDDSGHKLPAVGNQHLSCHIRSGKQRTAESFFFDVLDCNDFHLILSFTFLFLRETGFLEKDSIASARRESRDHTG